MIKHYLIIFVCWLFHQIIIPIGYAQTPVDGENKYRLAALNPLANSLDTLTYNAGRGVWVADNPDLDNDGKPEILVTDYQKGGRIFVYEVIDNDVLELAWVSKTLSNTLGGGFTPRSVTTGDFDNNGRQEIIFQIGYFFSDTLEFANRGIYFYEWTGNDNDYGDEPIHKITYESIDSNFVATSVGRTESGLRVQDIDGDSRNELLFPPRAFSFSVAKLYILEVESGTFDGGNVFIENEYIYEEMVQPPIIAPDGYVPVGTEIGDVDNDGFDEIIVAGWNNIAAGAGLGFIQIDGPDSYTPGSIVPLADFSAFIVKAKPLFTMVNGNPVIYLNGTDAATENSKIWIIENIISDASVSSANIKELFTNVGFWGAWDLGDQDHTTASTGDGFDLYLYGGGGRFLDIEYNGFGDVADSNSYEITQIFDLEKIYDNVNGLFNDVFTYPGMDLDRDGNRDLVASYKGSFLDTLNGVSQNLNGRHVFFFEWGDSTKSVDFLCEGFPPNASTTNPSNVSTASATLNGIINPNGAETEIFFEYGITTEYGNIIPANESPLNGTSPVLVHADISGLSENTTYHYRVVGTNCARTTNGEDQVFTTSQIFITPLSISFGNITIGDTAMDTVVVKNIGDSLLNVFSVSLVGPNSDKFSVDTTPFDLNGGDSLLLSVNFLPDTEGSFNASLNFVSNRGNASVFLSGNGVIADISVSPDTLNFEDVMVNDSSTISLMILNEGTDTLRVSDVSSDNPVFVIGVPVVTQNRISISKKLIIDPFDIAPGESKLLPVTFKPIAVTPYSGTLTITSNDPDENPINIPLIGNGVLPDIAIDPIVLDFGNIRVDSMSTLSISVTNVGTGDLNINASQIMGTDSAQYAITGGDGSVILPQGSPAHVIDITFTPTSTGAKLAFLRIFSDDPDENLFDVPLSGNGVAPTISLDPSGLDFGNVVVDSMATMPLIVSNLGNLSLTISDTAIVGNDASQFSISEISPLPFSISPQESDTIMITFRPGSFGAKSAMLQIVNNDPFANSVSIDLNGIGSNPGIAVNPLELNFGDVVVDSMAAKAIVVSNLGNSNLTVNDVSIVGTDANQFAVVSIPSLPFIIPPTGNDTILIQFTPVSRGSKTATLQILNDDPNNNQLVVPLSGTGFAEDNNLPPTAPANLLASAISSSQIDLNWELSTGNPEKYYVYRSLTSGGGFSIIDSVDHPSNSYNDVGLAFLTIYFYHISAINQWGESPFSNEANATTLNNETRVGEPVYAALASPGEATDIRSIITATAGVQNAQLRYRQSGTFNFTSVVMQVESGDVYLGEIPAAAVQAPGVEFKISVTDGSSTTTESALNYLGIILSGGTSNTNAQPTGNTVSGYRLFSVPLDLDNESPQAFLAANASLGSYDNTRYRWFDVTNTSLREYPDVDNVAPGKGFLFITNLPDIRFNSGSGRTISTVERFAINLPAGWSLIGNPFNFNIPFDSLSVSAGTFELWQFAGAWSQNTSGLEPWKGYAIEMSQAAEFRIRPGVAGLNTAASMFDIANNDAQNWLIQITAETAYSRDHFNFVGQDERVTNNSAALNLHEPPRLPQQVSTVFIDKNSGEYLTTDIRQPSQEGHAWEFYCHIDPQEENLTLRFDGLATIPAQFDAFLIDIKTNTAYPLYDSAPIAFITHGDAQRAFRLAVGTKAFLAGEAGEAELYPTAFELYQNFPNPFNPATQIEYTIPQTAHVELVVYNSTGQKVAVLTNDIKNAGRHAVIWNTNGLPSGIYFYRIHAEKFIKIKKCLLVK